MASIEWNDKKSWFELSIDGNKPVFVSDNKKALLLMAEEMGYTVEGEENGLHV